MGKKLPALLCSLVVGGCVLTGPDASLVNTTIESFPRRIDFVCMLADTPQGLVLMPWVTRGPKGAVEPSDPSDPDWVRRHTVDGTLKATVEWKYGRRYAVLTRDEGGYWRVWWLKGDRVKIVGENVLLKRPGELDFFLSAYERVELASPELLRQLQVKAPPPRPQPVPPPPD